MKDYHVDAFAKNVFTGNPAVVCVLDHWPDDGLMQQIAIENNLSETAYTVPEGDDYRLRWFTPGGEIDLCGHATLATAFVLANFIEPERQVFHFHTLGGDLTVRREGELFSMDFPAYAMQPVAVTAAMTAAIGRRPLAAYMARDLVCIMDDEDFVRQAEPNQEKIRELDGLLLHITAKGRDYDCVSRSFAPKLKVPEDPVCGSGHCHILPIWAAREGKTALHAYQASQRGGELFCQVHGDRVTLSGYACLYSTAELHV
ncbi:PhzF family phenazine biosynthesis protein [Megasphaera vaginalis (ex Bordigoni et al. 2020)]|uniref:PhzF family phenazine biosynthesis protein n=1 Tax=Megasphaera vaginalis (ex Bordigoni et al. 2020) TaxID=2045301 RepID=UPI000C79D266|nr:PhzF family phenazine biosynthesis protein [Megasphaera vaginalis (ex Bordigoni et al. 2020)]